MKRLFRSLIMPAFLTVLWLLLNDTVAPEQILLGAAISIGLVRIGARLRPLQAHPKKPLTIAKLVCAVIADIVRSNLAVGRLIWPGAARATPGFVAIPLELRDPHGLAALACIITCTPGTVWAGLTDDDRILTLHVLDLKDESQWIRTVKQRYELPLLEIFE
ncbi:Na+/H+ antiporter subunit E [Paralcaligenes ureilyticus]|uniref:Multisubunit potassium/proton antiporter PhaE subunit n=1 Tax=Paralcaligenes ureilyticus TaxID=627131 RepID=A0A4V6NZE9_9BURK|nr:Na+/H+ antiporter subunit E [Paralcaligenes ureilyticus]TCT00578.1 multisubunit potassium/proton antiporter PhaE subunit [Paralcaligenes ureilyticus]